MKKRFTEKQIIGVLREAEAGAKVAELLRKNGVSEETFYNWKAKYGGELVYREEGALRLTEPTAAAWPAKLRPFWPRAAELAIRQGTESINLALLDRAASPGIFRILAEEENR